MFDGVCLFVVCLLLGLCVCLPKFMQLASYKKLTFNLTGNVG